MEKAQLDSTELYGLWTNYMADSLSKYVLQHFQQTVQDSEIATILNTAMTLSEAHLDFITELFNKEEITLPIAFSDNDINSKAPRLFTDVYYLYYLKNMATGGLANYSVFLSGSSRKDIRDYVTENLITTSALINQTIDLLINKGLQIRAPHTPYPAESGHVDTQHFLSGWLGKQRPLIHSEVSNMFVDLQLNSVARSLLTGFSQTAQNENVRRFFLKGRDITNKNMEVISDTLKQGNLHAPVPWAGDVTESTTWVFSDKLLMNQVMFLCQSFISTYGITISSCRRRDIVANYVRLVTEFGAYSAEGAELMIENRWLEKPPMVADRDGLAKR